MLQDISGQRFRGINLPTQNVRTRDNAYCVYIFKKRYIYGNTLQRAEVTAVMSIISRALMHAQYASTVCNSNLEYRCMSEGTPRGDSRQRIHVCKRSRSHRHKRHVHFRNAEVNKPELAPRVNGQYL